MAPKTMAAQMDPSIAGVVQIEHASVTPAMKAAQLVMTTPTQVVVETPMMDASQPCVTATPWEEVMRLELPTVQVTASEVG
jgi:hypothetical protein